MTDLAIIGGGAAGLAAAVTAHECGDRVTIFEQGNTIGRKIAASGNGRCNLMNSGTPRFYGDAAFAEKVLGHCPQKRLTRYWRYLGIYLNEETEGRMYPSTFRSGTVNDAYRIRLKSAGTTVLLQTRISEIRKEGKIFRIFSDDREYTASRVLIACGGALFYISDFVLLREVMFPSPKVLDWIVMVTYYSAVLLFGIACLT